MLGTPPRAASLLFNGSSRRLAMPLLLRMAIKTGEASHRRLRAGTVTVPGDDSRRVRQAYFHGTGAFIVSNAVRAVGIPLPAMCHSLRHSSAPYLLQGEPCASHCQTAYSENLK